MKIIKLTCPNCNANLDLDSEREFGFCQYCGTKVYIQEEPPNTVVNQVITNNVNITINNNSEEVFISNSNPDKFDAIKNVYINDESEIANKTKYYYWSVCLLTLLFFFVLFYHIF